MGLYDRLLKVVDMKTIESIKDFKEFLKTNHDKLLDKAVRIEDLPIDDEWIQDNIWDKEKRAVAL